jgi:glycosyltransferase involved in cell wall biosynthesis
MAIQTPHRPRFHYLVGGLRISLEGNSTTPGPRTHILGFINALRGLGYSVELFVASEQPGLKRFARVREGQAGSTFRGPLSFVVDAIRLIAALWSGVRLLAESRKMRSGIIYERAAVYQNLTAFHLHRKQSLRLVESNGIMSRESMIDRRSIRLSYLASAIERRLYKSASYIVAVSSELRNEIIEFASVDPKKVIVLKNASPRPVELEHADIVARRNGPIVIGFIGSIVGWQQLDILIDAVASINSEKAASDHRREVQIEIVGDGPELANLKQAAWLQRDKVSVTFFGPLDHTPALETGRHWSLGYSGHAASSSKNMYHSPLKLYEYAALALPSLTTWSRDAAELERDGMPMYFFGSRSELANQIRRVASEPAGSEAGHEWAPAVVQKHSWESRVTELLDVLAQQNWGSALRES